MTTVVDIESLRPNQLLEYKGFLFSNVESLCQDAMLLWSKRRFARAYSLAILGSEELAKLLMVMVRIHEHKVSKATEVPWAYISKMMLDHKFKISLFDTLSSMQDEIIDQLKAKNPKTISGPSRDEVVATFATAGLTNLMKLDGFYVGFDGSHFKAPSTSISRKHVADALMELAKMLMICRMFDAMSTQDSADLDKFEATWDQLEATWDKFMAEVEKLIGTDPA